MSHYSREEQPGEDFGEAVVLAKGPKAMLLGFRDLGKKHWVPYSQFHSNSDLYQSSAVGDDGSCVISRWLADKDDFQDTDTWESWEEDA